MDRKSNKKQMSYTELEKAFGIKASTIRYRLNKGYGLKEALNTPVNSYMLDLTGMQFGRLTVQSKIPGSHTSGCKWHCICTCGNECNVLAGNLLSGRQVSCGCLNMDRRHERHKDYSGCIINEIEILHRTDDEIDDKGNHFIHYMCKCPFCDNLFDSRINNIKSGNTTGCGCTRYQYVHIIDLTGQNFEFCHVNKRVEDQIQPSGGSRVMYECVCTCGKLFTEWAFRILHGRANCGCVKQKSKGEAETEDWLIKHDISFVPEFWFYDLRSEKNRPLFFDFALFDEFDMLLGLIEYQGIQHFQEVKCHIPDFGKQQREVTDPMKKEYCQKNSIKLFEIAYNEDVATRCEEIYNVLYHDNTVPSESSIAEKQEIFEGVTTRREP